MKKCYLLFVLALAFSGAMAQKEGLPKMSAGFPVNYEEDSVGRYPLPDVLLLKNGRRVMDATTWTKQRRPEILQMIEDIQFGRMPPGPKQLRYRVRETGSPAWRLKAIRKQVRIFLSEDTTRFIDLLMYLPVSKKPVPVLLSISFAANNQLIDDPAVDTGYTWTREGQKVRADQAGRFGKIDVLQFIDAGIGFATFYYGNVEPDFKKGMEYGIRKLYLKAGQQVPGENEWGAIAAWAWGLSRVMDYFEKDPAVDSKRVAIQGASRLGKTVLWAGARDTRFKVVIASISGEGGAALTRRNYGENIKHITDTSRYHYWFAPAYHSYASRVNELPFDAHMLVALIAPRALLLQTGDSDYWSDPHGEFLSAIAAEPVYRLFGERGPGTKEWPQPNDPTILLNKLGYYMHRGGHTVLPEDWLLFIQYLRKYL